MFFHDFLHPLRRLEEQLEREIAELLRLFPHRRYHRKHERDTILFEFQFFDVTILQPQSMKKVIGAFTGALVFLNAEGQKQDISSVTNLSLTANDATIGNVTLDPATGKFSGNGIAVGDLVLTVSATNDAGNQVSNSLTISFHADTTVTDIEFAID